MSNSAGLSWAVVRAMSSAARSRRPSRAGSGRPARRAACNTSSASILRTGSESSVSGRGGGVTYHSAPCEAGVTVSPVGGGAGESPAGFKAHPAARASARQAPAPRGGREEEALPLLALAVGALLLGG